MHDKCIQLENIVWRSLAGPQQAFATGDDEVRRYASGFSPIAGFANNQSPALDKLSTLFAPDESFYTDGWKEPVPDQWTLVSESTMYKMTWNADQPPADDAGGAQKLDGRQASAALKLAQLTQPGPFAIRTIELGEYWGYTEGGRLIAMAGERMFDGYWREISGVCTDPERQGLGLARRLMSRLIRRITDRGECPFLHVMTDNSTAVGLYQRMGFSIYKESVVRVLRRQDT